MQPPASKSHVLETYEEMAEEVEERRQTPWADVADFEKTLPHGRSVLDMGCGTGRNAVHFALAGHTVIGLDFSRRLLEKAAERTARTPVRVLGGLLQADVASMPIKESSIDSCIYVATLHHLPTREDRLGSLREIGRCLKPGGIALISVWALEQERFEGMLKRNRGVKKEPGDVFVPIKTRSGKTINRFYHLFMEDELGQLVKEAGLDIMRCFKSHDNYFAVAVKPHNPR